VRSAGVFVAGLLTPLVLLVMVLWWAGVGDIFWKWTFIYAAQHSRQFTLDPLFLYLENLDTPDVVFWSFAAGGVVLLCRDPKIAPSRRVFLGAAFVFSFLSVCPGFYFRHHYFILMLPIAAASVAGAFRIALPRLLMQAGSEAGDRTVQWLLSGAFIGLCLFAVAWNWAYYFTAPPSRIAQEVYAPNPFLESKSVAQFIKNHSSRADRITVLGSEPEIYFYADRRSATGYIYMYDLTARQRYAREMQEQMIREVEQAQPEYVVCVHNPYSWLTQEPNSVRLLSEWMSRFLKNYERVGLAEQEPGGETAYKWGAEAADANVTCELYLEVLRKRRPPERETRS
jgi:hypothetical protein